MGGNLPDGVTVSDIPPNEKPKKPMNGECAVCGKPIPSHLPPRKDPNTPKFCDNHDKDDHTKEYGQTKMETRRYQKP